MTERRLPEELRRKQIDFTSLDEVSYGDLVRAYLAEEAMAGFQPEHRCTIDPRNGDPQVVVPLPRPLEEVL